MYKHDYIQTARLKTSYYREGEENDKKLLLIHGNVSSAVFYLPLFPELAKDFDVVAIDLRCYGDSSEKPVNARRGMRDWTEDIQEFVEALGWTKYSIAGWSMGGCIAMQYTIDYADQLEAVVLIAPGSPFGFGGTYDEDGKPLKPLGLASGGGCANPKLVRALVTGGNRELFISTLKKAYFTPEFEISEYWLTRFIESMKKTKVGNGKYPGSAKRCLKWPFVVSGRMGICNTMSPKYCDLSSIAEIEHKVPILWVRGTRDTMVSDTSVCDFGYLGKAGIVPGYPGENILPPQPMVAQTRYVLDKYRANGGIYKEVVLEGGHGCHIESPAEFLKEVRNFIL